MTAADIACHLEPASLKEDKQASLVEGRLLSHLGLVNHDWLSFWCNDSSAVWQCSLCLGTLWMVRVAVTVLRSGTDVIFYSSSSSSCSSCWGNLFKKRLRHFKSDRHEIWHERSSHKYALTDMLDFWFDVTIFKMVAMTSFHTAKWCADTVSENEMSATWICSKPINSTVILVLCGWHYFCNLSS